MNRRQSVKALAALSLMNVWGASRAAGDKGLVGISMPTMGSQRWVYDGLGMMRALNQLDYTADLQYANDSSKIQIDHLQAMLGKGARMLVIGAVDGGALTGVLAEAGKRGVKVLAYDRLIRNSANVDSYATFDNFAVGELQARDIESRLRLAAPTRPFTLELFAGDADDNNTHMFYDGAMSVLKRYIDGGQLVVGSGKVALKDIYTPHWSGSHAKGRLQGELATTYARRRLDAVLSPYDGISIEVLSAFKFAGYGQPAQPLPVVTGQDAELASVRSIKHGEQASTVFKDTRLLVKQSSRMVDDTLSGRPVSFSDLKTYQNGVKVVPAVLLKPVLVDKANLQSVLVDSGYYKLEQV
ncbi:MAG TPA: sugar-binding protein [Ideonella sp.]|uniref:sugar-binding protein n=1 Tax=Ideonella sp. TaxID=1929293 RepID=UPI002CF44447|nr:sugar-binding protein [Ideonella sp.]HSI47444.1 sugar-binding protein [Ideonella sp.]